MAFRFLDLAAELRNRIYEFAALSDKDVRPTHTPLGHDGNYAALTRVCRQIRTEYLPLQRAAADVIFDFHDLHKLTEYLTIFYSDEGCGGTSIDPYKITIEVGDGSGGNTTQDVLPLLKFHDDRPRTRVEVPSILSSPPTGRLVRVADMDVYECTEEEFRKAINSDHLSRIIYDDNAK